MKKMRLFGILFLNAKKRTSRSSEHIKILKKNKFILFKSEGVLKDIPNINVFYFSSIVSIIGIASALIFYKNLPPQIPLYYGVPEGETQIAPSTYLLIPSTIGFFLTIVNFVLVKITSDSFLQKSLIIASAVVSVLAFITTIKIIRLVGSF